MYYKAKAVKGMIHKMEKKEMLYEGKAKKVYTTDDDNLYS